MIVLRLDLLMEFMAGDMVRFGFGFSNPNHAAALFCALVPFCWGWTRKTWIGYILTIALLVAIAMTFSRTGFLVLALEAIAWNFIRPRGGDCRPRLRLAILIIGAVAIVWWMAPRLSIDGAVTNRPKIWLAGLKLWFANPHGVGLGNSGLLASTFLLPPGVEVRTLVNSHLTLLAEMGRPAGVPWLAFIGSAVFCGRAMPRTWLAFSGLALSSCVASVFDWHVLLIPEVAAGYGMANRLLAWWILVFFVAMGIVLIVRGFRLRPIVIVTTAIFSLSSLCPLAGEIRGVPLVASGYLDFGGSGPLACHDRDWSLKAMSDYLPEGAKIRIRAGIDDKALDSSSEIWLFGSVSESAYRFRSAAVTVVGAPEFYEPSDNVRRVISMEEE